MRWINKEYGFAFRPPFFDKFFEEKSTGPQLEDAHFPLQYKQGVGFDFSAINGAMLIGKRGSLWGVRVSYYNGKKWLGSEDFVRNMGGGCANTEDGSFAHFSSGPLSVKWIRHNEQSMIAQISARKRLRVRAIFYPCFGWPGDLSIEGNYVMGRSSEVGVIGGQISLGELCASFRDRYQVINDSSDRKEYFMARSYNNPSDWANGAFNEAIMEFVINKNQPNVHIFASVGDESVLKAQGPNLDRIKSQIEAAELRYGTGKTMGSGVLGSSSERMYNSIFWSRIYYPYLMTEIFAPKRSSLDTHFNIMGAEENCAAILGSLLPNSAADKQLTYTLEDKIMALPALWHIYAHSEDKSGMRGLYKRLIETYPPNAALVQTSSHEKTEVAYGWTDSPLKERFEPAPMYSLDLSCLRLFAFDILERIAVIFGYADAAKYAEAKREMIEMINEVFWNDDEGMYIGRYVTGKWCNSYGATSFYPLIAGAVDSSFKLTRMVNNMTNPNKFWNEYLVPTLSMDNRQYGKKGKPNNNGVRKPPYLEYRGSIVPYVNYLIYHGLKRYGLDEIAGEVAVRSCKLWTHNTTDNVENYSLYLPGGGRVKSPEYLSTNGNMLALIGVQELIGIEYYRDDLVNALRFGTFVGGVNSISNLRLLGKSYSIECSDTLTTLLVDGVNIFRGEGGKFVVRNFVQTDTGYEFMIDAHSHINITINSPATKTTPSAKYFFIVPPARCVVIAENGMVSVRPIEPGTSEEEE